MITVKFDLARVQAMGDRFAQWSDPVYRAKRFALLMQRIAGDLAEDNRVGLLSGQTGDGGSMRQCDPRYRTSIAGSAVWRAPDQRGQRDFPALSGTGWPDNLKTREYKKLTGSVLVPRGEQSRLIANIRFETDMSAADRYAITKMWRDILDRKGRPFMRKFLMDPTRKFTGIRPEGRRQIKETLARWRKAVGLEMMQGKGVAP